MVHAKTKIEFLAKLHVPPLEMYHRYDQQYILNVPVRSYMYRDVLCGSIRRKIHLVEKVHVPKWNACMHCKQIIGTYM